MAVSRRLHRHLKDNWSELLIIILAGPLIGFALGYAAKAFRPAISGAIE